MVGMDRVSIYRRALQCLGEAEYVEGSATAGALEVAYKGCVLEACSRYNWSFTRRQCRLEKVGEEGVDGKVLFGLPVDCVKVVEVMRGDGRRVSDVVMVGGGVRVPAGEAAEVWVDYHGDIMGYVGQLSEGRTAFFTEGLVRLLASRVCMQVTSNGGLAGQLRQESEEFFYRAILHDKQQDWSNAKEPRVLLAQRRKN